MTTGQLGGWTPPNRNYLPPPDWEEDLEATQEIARFFLDDLSSREPEPVVSRRDRRQARSRVRIVVRTVLEALKPLLLDPTYQQETLPEYRPRHRKARSHWWIPTAHAV